MRAKAIEFVIQEDEAKVIAEPLSEVLSKWGINFGSADNPYFRLGTALLTVYGMRVVSYSVKKKTLNQKPVVEKPMSDNPVSNTVPVGMDFSALEAFDVEARRANAN
jgi:hypothetical protein